MFSVTSPDGTPVLAYDEGRGPAIVVLGPGSDDGSAWEKVARLLAGRFRVLRVHRRQYRLDLDNPRGFPMSTEADDVIAVAQAIEGPVLLIGHSSGGVAALEAIVAAPSAFSGVVLYEPPVTIDDVAWTEPLSRAVAAIDQGKPGRAMTIFARDVVDAPAWTAYVGGALVAVIGKYRDLAPRQIFDMAAIHELGVRLEAYATISLPALVLSGERSPRHLGDRIDALVAVLPDAEKVVLTGQGHTANKTAPDELAALIGAFHDRLA